MAAQTLTWGPSSYGNFVEAAQWLPREAPTPNVGQTLNIRTCSSPVSFGAGREASTKRLT